MRTHPSFFPLARGAHERTGIKRYALWRGARTSRRRCVKVWLRPRCPLTVTQARLLALPRELLRCIIFELGDSSWRHQGRLRPLLFVSRDLTPLVVDALFSHVETGLRQLDRLVRLVSHVRRSDHRIRTLAIDLTRATPTEEHWAALLRKLRSWTKLRSFSLWVRSRSRWPAELRIDDLLATMWEAEALQTLDWQEDDAGSGATMDTGQILTTLALGPSRGPLRELCFKSATLRNEILSSATLPLVSLNFLHPIRLPGRSCQLRFSARPTADLDRLGCRGPATLACRGTRGGV